jgi:prophage regulatory protein
MKSVHTRRTIRRIAVLAKTGLCRTSLYHLERKGEFPIHFLLTPRCAVWFEDEIDLWLEERRNTLIKAAQWPNVALRKTSRGRPAKS